MQNARRKDDDTAVREKLFTMRMSAEEWARAEKLAEHNGITVAALVRMLLKNYERELAALEGPDASKSPSKPPPAKGSRSRK